MLEDGGPEPILLQSWHIVKLCLYMYILDGKCWFFCCLGVCCRMGVERCQNQHRPAVLVPIVHTVNVDSFAVLVCVAEWEWRGVRISIDQQSWFQQFTQ